MTNGKKILLISGVVTVAIGSFALTLYLTRQYEKKKAILNKKDVEKIVEDYDVFNNPVIE
jgi:hypothetical protein